MRKAKPEKKNLSNKKLGDLLVGWALHGKDYSLIKFVHSIGITAKELTKRAETDESLSEKLQIAREASEQKINEMALSHECDITFAKYLIDYNRQFFKNDIGDEPVIPVVFVEAETKSSDNSAG